MAEKLEVFVVEPCEVDWFAFSLWLGGCSEEEATTKRAEREPESSKDFPDYDTLLRSETRNSYRMFRALEVHLQSPPSLFAQVRESWRQLATGSICCCSHLPLVHGGWVGFPQTCTN